MKILRKAVLALMTLITIGFSAKAEGWPANFQGVMLQGFEWDSFTDTKWTNLTSQADELSQYFKLIWVPNSGNCGSTYMKMGYMPVYWFTNHNSSFGTEAELRNMISTFKAKGTGIIADVVINHRNGRTNWTDFPTETWNGQTWKIGLDGICRSDEVNNPGNPGGATGAYDTGEDFNGARDLDHTNANVQNNCKNYCKFLLTDLGYSGFRLDMVKGYSGQYTKMYNQYAKPTYCVGEYWDGSYNALAAWIESTGGESAAFDFAFKYALNEAFGSGDMTKLVWMENGNTPKPAGLIHHWYQKLAVTFIDNHDTYRDDWNKFGGNVVAANAFMICSPGTPCVFLPHWKKYKSEIKKMIAMRNACGITNTSEVKVLQTNSSCYMAEVTGTKGKLVVKIGSAQVSPSGYSNSDIRATGTDYCIWSKTPMPSTGGGGGDDAVSAPSKLYLMGDLPAGHWVPNVGVSMTKSGNNFTAKNVKLEANTGETKAFFSFVEALGKSSASTEWDATINASDRYGATSKDQAISVGSATPFQVFYAGVDASSAYAWGVAPGSYDVTVDFSKKTVTLVNAGTTPTPDPDPNPNPNPDPQPAVTLYLVGHVNGTIWTPADAIMHHAYTGGVHHWNDIEIGDAGEGYGYFSFITQRGSDWDTEVNIGDRYGAETKDEPLIDGQTSNIALFAAGVNASAAYSWKVEAGKYNISANLSTMKITLNKAQSGIDSIGADNDQPAVYYNLQGRRVDNPTSGAYILVKGGKATKIIIR